MIVNLKKNIMEAKNSLIVCHYTAKVQHSASKQSCFTHFNESPL